MESFHSDIYSCRYEFEDDIHVCWPATSNNTYATSVIEYDHGSDNFYDGARYGIENCLFLFLSFGKKETKRDGVLFI